MDRRDILVGFGAAAAGLTVAGNAEAAASAPLKSVPISPEYKYTGVDGKLPINRQRAYAVMEEIGVVGLVALNPINVYYLTNTISLGAKFRAEFPAFATFPKDPSQPTYLIGGASQALEMANNEREVPELIVVSGASNWQDCVKATPAQMKIEPKSSTPGFNSTGGFAVRPGGPYTEREQRWINAQKAAGARSAPTPAWALAKALKDSGMSKGRIAVDDMRIAYLLDEIGMTGITCVPAEKAFQKIRMVKSDVEIPLMRIAGRNNAVAAMNTIKSIEKGMTFQEIERRFSTEAAALGNLNQSFIAGVSLALLPDGVTVPGKPFLIDAVSHFRQYHGDFGRTVVLGEPSKEIVAREKAHKIGRDAVFEIVKPGVKFSELRRVAKDAQVKAGLPEQVVIVVAHCVGLAHDDNPSHPEVPFTAPYDHVLEENMVLTIDLANVEIGWGACHHEDMFRVTKTGFEYLGPPGDPLVIV